MDMSVDDFLSFKDFTNVHGQSSNPIQSTAPAQINVNSPEKNDLIYDIPNSGQNLSSGAASGGNSGGGNNSMFSSNSGSASEEEKTKTVSFFSLEYYQQFFNVDTYMVLDRIASSIIPKRAPANYLKFNIGQNPDLYGPFWITITLIFSIAISGNVASYLQHANESYRWRYNFHLVSYAATSIFIYACFFPVAIWALLKYSLKPVDDGFETENANYTPSLLSLMCVYGYSLTIYIPVSILWVIQISILQWLLVITAAFLSGTALIIVLTPALRNSNLSLFIIFGILSAHFMLAAGFMLYFFHMPTPSGAIVPPTSVPVQLPITSAAAPAAAAVIPANLVQQVVVSTLAALHNSTG